jgi:hypothetical protein
MFLFLVRHIDDSGSCLPELVSRFFTYKVGSDDICAKRWNGVRLPAAAPARIGAIRQIADLLPSAPSHNGPRVPGRSFVGLVSTMVRYQIQSDHDGSVRERDWLPSKRTYGAHRAPSR